MKIAVLLLFISVAAMAQESPPAPPMIIDPSNPDPPDPIPPSSVKPLWDGGFDCGGKGAFCAWHSIGDRKAIYFHAVPGYGRPIQYGDQKHTGNGELLKLVSSSERIVDGISYPKGPTRCGDYSARFTVKNSSSWSTKSGSDGDLNLGYDSSARRTELWMHMAAMPQYGLMEYQKEYWVRVSMYIPDSWDRSGNGWGVILHQVKGPTTDKIGPAFSIQLADYGWGIRLTTAEGDHPTDPNPWQHQISYKPDEPSSDNYPDGLKDFPDIQVSRNALSRVTTNNWTDWAYNVRWDGRGEDGNGFFKLYKRDGNGDWVQILDVKPRRTTRGGMTFQRGIGYRTPGSGVGPIVGQYMETSKVQNAKSNLTYYNDCMSIFGSEATLQQVAP